MAGTASSGAGDGAGDGVQGVRERVCADAVSDRPHGPASDLSPAELESVAIAILPHARTTAMLKEGDDAGVRMLRSEKAMERPRAGKRGGDEGERGEVPALAGEGQGDPTPVPAGVTPATNAEIVACLRPSEITAILDIEAPESIAMNTGSPRPFPRM